LRLVGKTDDAILLMARGFGRKARNAKYIAADEGQYSERSLPPPSVLGS